MACPHYVVSLFLLVELAIFSTGQIPIGSQLSAGQNQVWLSENNTFAFGFTSSGSDDQFLLAIWYSELPGDPTVIWSPNRESPVGRDAVVKLDLTGNLVLFDGNSSLWMSNTSSEGVKYALMSESGSFILYNGSSNDSQIVWQSFWHPSDTLLPEQQLTVSLELSSVKSSLGYYSLKMLQQRTSLSLALTYVSPESYNSSPEFHANYSYWSSPEISNATGDVVAVLDRSGNFGIMYGSSSSGTMYVHKNDTGGSTSTLRRVTIGADGNLRLYRWDESWVIEWSALSNPCMAAGICGSGVCTLDGSKTNSSCTCLQGASLVSSGDKGCSSSSSTPSPVKCGGNRTIGVKMETVAQTNYYFSGASTIKNYSNVNMASQCSDYCFSDCDCVASVYGLEEDKPYCWTLKSLVFGGYQDPSSTLYMKVASNGSQAGGSSGGESSSDKSARVLVLPLLLCTSALAFLLSFLLWYSIRRRRMIRQQAISSLLSFPGAPVYFNYHVLQSATGNFSRLIGTGGFGRVYKGTLRDGTLIAVKKLERILPHGEKEFITEVTTIGSMHHMNLVGLCGFCSEGSHRLLVYEYMSNGSLDKWIFPSYDQQDRLLDWKTRYQIAIAIAEGIAYFHEQCRNRVLHCDIKPENILLDDNLCPKVSDFGLAKLMNRGHSEVITMVRGTRGYLAPEWISSRPITVKADVYSYGMLLLEIIGGRRNLDMSLDAEDYYYPGWAFKEMTNGTALHAADPRLEGKVDEEEMLRALKCAFWYIQEEAWSRPSMGEVVRMLEGSVEINEPPMPQAILELMDEGLENIYKAMKRDFFTYPLTSSSLITSQPSSRATCSYSTMSPR